MAWFFRRKNEDNRPDTGEDGDTASDQVVETIHTDGPWDADALGDMGDRLDAGALWIPLVPGASLQFTLDRNRKQVLGVVYAKNGSALQLQAFAAPRSRGIWDEVRRDMQTSIAKQGGSSQETTGPFGDELRAQMPVPNSKDYAPHRFLGVDGPRWLLRATIYGKAGSDDAAASEMISIMKDVAVARGQTPHPPRELLPLEIPEQVKSKDQ